MPKSDLPFGSEFSPSQIDLRKVLELAKKHGGDPDAFRAAVRSEYFEVHDASDYNKGVLAGNTKIAMAAYGVVDAEAKLTEVGERLYQLRGDKKRLFEELARHILLTLNGAILLQCVQDMQASGEEVTLVTLREALEERGVHFPRGGKHPSIMRLWFEQAGIVVGGWRVDRKVLDRILGISEQEMEALAKLSREQRAFLKTLANVWEPGAEHLLSNDIERLASATYGVKFNEKNLPKEVLYPIENAGFITLKRGTGEGGRGARPFKVTCTEKLKSEVILPLLEQVERQTHPELRPLLRKPLGDILKEMRTEDRHLRGLALEALALRLMRLIDLSYVATRLRGDATGGAEVDLVFESSRLVFSRWQVQCKNTARVALDDVAKEVGLTHFLKSTVVVIVSTGEIGSEARRYANKIMRESNLCIVMINHADIAQVEKDPTAIVAVLNREAKHAMQMKVLKLDE